MPSVFLTITQGLTHDRMRGEPARGLTLSGIADDAIALSRRQQLYYDRRATVYGGVAGMQDAAELSMHHQFTGQRQRIIALVTMLAACLVSLTIDLPVARWMKQEHLTGRMQRLIAEGLEVSEAFGHGFGATLVILGVAVLDPLRRKTIPWLVAGSLGAGMAANSLKYLLPRIRPRDFDLSAGTFWDTFSKSEHTGWGMQSFPSAHTATAVGLAVMLAHCYPRGRWYFTLLASLVGLQRMAVSAHFPSDVLAGAAVGWVVGHLCAVGAQPSRVPAPGE